MRKMVTIFGLLFLVLGFSPSARADLHLSITVGSSNITCDNSTAAGVSACMVAGFNTTLGSNTITSGPISIGGYTIGSVNMSSNQPGTSSSADALANEFAVTNVSGTETLIVEYASDNFSQPTGSPLSLSASQAGTFTTAQVGDMQLFIGYGNAANTLAATGVAVSTPNCVATVAAPPEQKCSTASTLTGFARNGNFALAGHAEITLAIGDEASFSETVAAVGSSPLVRGDTATMGFWQNKNGQALILQLNGSSSSTALGTWLATNFPNLYGATSPNNLAGQTNTQVAAFFLTAFGNHAGVQGNTYAQVLTTALAVYATDITLAGGTYAAAFGFNVSAAGTGAKVFNVGNNGAAVGVPDGTSLTVFQLLQIANANFNGATSLFYGGDPTLTSDLNNIFNGINQMGDIS